MDPSPHRPEGAPPQRGLCPSSFQKSLLCRRRDPKLTNDLAGAVQRGPCLLSWASPTPSQSLEAPGGCAQAGPMGPTFHMVLLLQLDPTEVGDSPHGDVEALGHAHLEAVKVHLELDRYRREPGPGASARPPIPGQASSSWHSWTPGSGSRGRGAPSTWPLGGRASGWAVNRVSGRGGQTGQGQGQLGAGLAGVGQALALPAAPPAAGGRPCGPAHCDSVSAGCPGSWSRPPGPEGSLMEGGAGQAHQTTGVRPPPPLLSGKCH